MSGELQHYDPGHVTSETEFYGIALHHLDGQAAGDLVIAQDATHLGRLPIDTDGYVLTLVGGMPVWLAAPSGSMATDTIWDAKGDIAVGTGANTAAKLAVGADNTKIVAASGEATGLKWAADMAAISFIIDGGGSAITTGVKGYIEVPFACNVMAWAVLADAAGAIVIDVWKDTYANYPPTNADAMPGAGHEPTIVATNAKGQDTDASDWATVAIAAGDILAFNIDSCSTITKVTLSLKVQKTY